MKLLSIVFLVVLATASSAQYTEWEQFKTHHGRAYKSAEHESRRRAIFMENLKTIRKHNFEADLNLHTWYMGINQFGDMTDDEISNTMTGFNDLPRQYKVNSTAIDYGDFQAPSSLDWVKKGYVNKITNQGGCGSCYAFSAAVVLEGQYKKVFGKLKKFSEQQLVDCSRGNKGCRGGMMSRCFECVKKQGGVMLAKDYKYRAKASRCAYNRRKAKKFRIASIRTKWRVSERTMKKTCAKVGPLAIAINARAPGFARYRRGVFKVKRCSKRCNHAINLVGYGRDKRYGDYWYIRNSWGTRWGDRGYMKIARNKKCMCGICDTMQYPHVTR